MEAKDWITVAALITGPVAAVIITLWYQNRSQKYAAKERLFLTLMAHRRSNPPTFDWASSLNLIDVVFADSVAVVEKWHDLYNIVIQVPVNWGQWNHTYIELLSEMATVLNYRRLRQTDIDRYYAPEAHSKQAVLIQDVQTELLRVLKATQSLRAMPIDDGTP
jgi:hypothetical protein